MLTGDSLSVASHASPPLATPQTPATRLAHYFYIRSDALGMTPMGTKIVLQVART